MNDFQNLSVTFKDASFVDALLASKGLMFTKQVSVVFPFSMNYQGWVYNFRCDTMVKIKILQILSQIP